MIPVAKAVCSVLPLSGFSPQTGLGIQVAPLTPLRMYTLVPLLRWPIKLSSRAERSRMS